MNMLRLRLFSDAQPRSKKGQPAHSTTGVASSELQPVRGLLPQEQVQAGQMPTHLQGHDRQRKDEPDPEAAASSRRARGWARPRQSPRRARAPCRRSGRSRARPGAPRGASGRCRLRPWAPAAPAPSGRDSAQDRPRTWPGSRRSRNGRCGQRARGGASPCAGRRPSRIPGPSPCRRQVRLEHGDARRERGPRSSRDGPDGPCWVPSGRAACDASTKLMLTRYIP